MSAFADSFDRKSSDNTKRKKKSRSGKKLGKEIVVCLQKNGWTQKQFAEAAGVKDQLICLLVNGKHGGAFKDKDTLSKIMETIDGCAEPMPAQSLPMVEARVVTMWQAFWAYIGALISKALGGAR
jgi:predicted XRE-type DNA-binding protein